MGERERAGLVIAAGLLLAAFIVVCGGFCSGIINSQIHKFL
jgi:hypothetical protein